MYRSCAAILLVLLLSHTSKADEDDVTWIDKFLSADMAGYQADGDIAWNKRLNGVRLNPQAILARSIPIGFTAEVRVDIWLPQGLGPKRGVHVTLRERSAVNHTTAFVGIEKGKPILGVMEYPGTPFPLPRADANDAGEGPWILRMRLRYGVVQAKVWLKDQPEPADWQVTRYTSDSGWEPRMVGIYTGENAGIVDRLQVTGTFPATDLFLRPDVKSSEQNEQLIEHMKHSASLRRQGKFREALPEARKAVELSRAEYGADHAVTATCLHTLGILLFDDGQYAAALESLVQSLKVRRAALPAKHPHIAASLDGVGGVLTALGQLNEAKQHYEEGLALRREVLGEQHPDTAYSYNNLGQAHSLLVDYPAALDCFHKSLTIREAVFGERHPDTAKALNNLGCQIFAGGDYLGARPYFDRALNVYRDVLGANHPDTATTENNLGFLRKAMGQFRPALEHFERATQIYTESGGPRHVLRAVALNNQAIVYCELGDYTKARALIEEALSIRTEVLGAEHPDTAMLQVNLAAAILPTGDDPAAAKLVIDAIRILVEKLPPDHPTLALVLQNMAVSFDDAEYRQLMRVPLELALAINHKRLGSRHPQTINVQNSLAMLLCDLGEPRQAQQLLTQSLQDCEGQLGANHPLVAYLHHNLGAANYQLGDLKEAEQQFRRSADSFRQAFGPQHPDTARSLNLLAVTLGASGQRAEALRYAATSAAAFSDVARRTLAGTAEAQHASLLNRWRPEVQLFTALALADPELPAARAEELLNTILDWKAASGRSLLNRLEALVVSNSPESAKYEQLLVYRRQIVQETIRGAGNDSVETYNARLASLQERMNALERELGRTVQDYAAIGQVRQADAAELIRHLPEGTALVEFIHQPQFELLAGPAIAGVTVDECYAAIVMYRAAGATTPTIKLVSLGLAAEIDKLIHTWRTETKRAQGNAETDAMLRQRLWSPLAAVLPANVRRLFLAPDGQLALVPFEAVRMENESYLIEKYQLSYVTTGRDLVPRPTSTAKLGAPVVLSDPAYDLTGYDAASAVAANKALDQTRSLAFANNPRRQSSLPGFDVEASAVTKLLTDRQPDQPVHFLPRSDATEEGAAVVARPRLLYFITHGGYMADSPRNSAASDAVTLGRDTIPGPGGTALLTLGEFGEDPRLRSVLYLAGCNHWRERAAVGLSDGLLTALEVQSLDLWGTELVVASACDTGIGEVRVGEGVLGLRRAFQQAGARTVVSSLWKVPDEQTKTMMPRFLELWLAGQHKAEALRQSQLETIRTLRASDNPRHREASPFYWAAFVCHGL